MFDTKLKKFFERPNCDGDVVVEFEFIVFYRSRGPDPPKRERRLQTEDGRMLNVNEPK